MLCSRSGWSTLLALTCAIALAPLSRAQEFDWSTVAPAERLMARRAARLDGLRELSELVKSLPIGGGRQLGDLGVDLSAFLAGAQEKGEPDYAGSGFCKLQMTLAGDKVIAEAKALATSRQVAIDAPAFERAVGAGLEVTGLGRPRSAPPVADLRQGRPDRGAERAPPKDEPSAGGPSAQPLPIPPAQPIPPRPGVQPWSRDDDRELSRQAWDREWAERTARWERAWNERRAPEQGGYTVDPQDSIEAQWQRAREMGDGWREMEDGSRVRLLSERITERVPVRRSYGADPRWGGEVIEETITERVIERRYVVK